MSLVRYGVPAAFVLMGVLMLILGSDANRWDGFFMAIGAAMAILLLNVLFRQGVEGDRDRANEEAARDYFSRHGHWPDERPKR